MIVTISRSLSFEYDIPNLDGEIQTKFNSMEVANERR